MLVPLHVKSHYSLGHGTAPVERLVERAAMLGLPALALTDIENLYGQVVFHKLAGEKSLHAITGAELRSPAGPSAPDAGVADRPPGRGRVVLLAKDPAGYENLSRIITRRRLGKTPAELRTSGLVFGDGSAPDPLEARDSPPEDPLDSIREAGEGLFILIEDPRTAERLSSVPGVDPESLRLLLVRPPRGGRGLAEEHAILEASSRLGIPLVADPDVDFLDPEDRLLHLLVLSIGRNALISEVEASGIVPPAGRHFPGPRECEALFADVPEAIRETERIAERCTLRLGKARPIFPGITLPPGETAYSHLARLAFHGLERRFARITPAHLERLASELRVIERLGFCEYFIVVGDIVRFARERGIEVVGRGSGAGSLVAHVLGITNVDPIEYGLYFERFLHDGRTDLPDIDIDLCWIRRDEVIDHVYRAYGHDRVAMISSHVTFQPHLAFREAIKAFGVPLGLVNRYSRRIPYIHAEVTSKSPLRDLIDSSPLARTIPVRDEPFLTALPLAERLLDHPHHLSVHPGGIVIGDRSVDAYAPLERAAKGIVVTQYDMYSIEDVGLVKIDLLGNRCLTELQETLELARGGPRRLAEIPDEDPRTVETLQAARTLGCFQLESPAMRSLLSKLRVRNVRDCIAAVAIIRPGAAAGGAKEAYIRRSRGEEDPSYLHPSLRKVLEESHGVVIYEEDVMRIASTIAGISLADGDRMRSAIKKCSHPDEFRELENDFMRRSIQNGISPDIAQAVWQDLRKFASYCFSKAHASGYGLLAYQSVYMKTHHPIEFACALFNNHAGMYSTRTLAEEAKRMGVRLIHPSVNGSEDRFTVEDLEDGGRGVRIGLSRVKSLSVRSRRAILDARRSGGRFTSLGDFLRRAPVPRREVEPLILSGSFDDLPPPKGASLPLNHPQLLWELRSTPEARDDTVTAPEELVGVEGRADHPPLHPYDPMKRIQNELDTIELAVTDHPLRLLRDAARGRGCRTTLEAAARTGSWARVAGIVAATRKIRTQKGEMMQFVTIEDEVGLLESTLFPAAYRSFGAVLRALGPYIFEGKVEEDRGGINLNLTRIERWDP